MLHQHWRTVDVLALTLTLALSLTLSLSREREREREREGVSSAARRPHPSAKTYRGQGPVRVRAREGACLLFGCAEEESMDGFALPACRYPRSFDKCVKGFESGTAPASKRLQKAAAGFGTALCYPLSYNSRPTLST